MSDEFKIDKGLPIPPRTDGWGWKSGKREWERWSEAEDALLQKLYGHIHVLKIAEILGRGVEATRQRIFKLGLRSEGVAGSYDLLPRPRTESQAIQDARRLYIRFMRRDGMALHNIGKRLGLTRERIRQMDEGSEEYKERRKRRDRTSSKPCLEGGNHKWDGGKCLKCGAEMLDSPYADRLKRKIGLGV